MLRLDDIQGGLIFHVFLDLDGDLDRQALGQALAETFADFPILASRVHKTRLGYRRVAVPVVLADAEAVIDWRPGADDDAERTFVQAWLPVGDNPPVRLLVRLGPRGTRLVAKIHHSSMDGLGAFLWLDQLARRYRERLAGAEPTARPPAEPSRSYAQYVWALSWGDRLSVLARGADAVTGFFVGAGTGTGGPNAHYALFLDQSPPTRGQIHYVVERLSPAEIATLKTWTRAHGATMNDVLFAAFAAAGQALWPQDALPVVAHIPVNLRQGPPTGVFNRVADVRVELDPRTLGDFGSAFKATLAVTPKARDRLQAVARVFERYVASHFPRKPFCNMVGDYMDRPRNGIMTFDFSNLGALGDLPGDFGAAAVTGGFLVGPMSAPPGLGCYVTTIRGELALVVGYLHPCMSHENAATLARETRRTLAGLLVKPEVVAG